MPYFLRNFISKFGYSTLIDFARGDLVETNERFRQAELAAIVGAIGNIVLAILKGILGVMGNSRALVADAANSASDVLGSIAVFVGLRAAKQPPDKEHPYGHGKAESIAAIIVSVLLFVVGIEMGRGSIEALLHPVTAPNMLAVYGALISIIIKEILFRYTIRIGKRVKSDAIIVSAYDHRTDVFSSLAALIGIGSALLGERFNITWLQYADPLAGVLVCLLILKMAWTVGAESIHNTLDRVLQEEETEELRKTVETVPNVKKINELFAREHGHYVIVDIKIAVDPYMTVEEGHLVGKKVKEKLMKLNNIYNVFVHINPYAPE